MIKSIFTQIWNRKRSNAWIVIELLLVFCASWYIVDYLFVLSYNYSLPNYHNTDHTWMVTLGEYPSDYAKYSPENASAEMRLQNFNRVIQALNDYDGIEAVGITNWSGGTPGSGNYNGADFYDADDSTTIADPNSVNDNGDIGGIIGVGLQVIQIDRHSDYFRVFGHTTDKGRQAVSTGDFNWAEPHCGVINSSSARKLFGDKTAVGRHITSQHYGDQAVFTVIGVIDDTKRFDWQRPQEVFYEAFPVDTNTIGQAVISIRSKANQPDHLFAEQFRKDMRSRLAIGNYFLRDIESYDLISARAATDFGIANEIRQRAIFMGFLLLNILLCVVGTFWYRINTRREEIGLKKALGSSCRSIRNGFLIEGLCLLALAALPAIVIEFQFVVADLLETPYRNNTVYLPDYKYLRFIITNAITWALMSCVILVAVWLPARRAAAWAAADALRDE
ncbi:MAG: hypothetical protein LBR50_10780 [Tannerella sp.]|jgi:hypothetical protein|nr:hypothetical protein [Tannerella sp.]